MRIVRATVDDLDEIVELDRACINAEGWEPERCEHWVVRGPSGLLAYASARLCEGSQPNTLDAYLERCGVAPEARGQGLQRRLVRARMAWARREGAVYACTYTAGRLTRSANNLIACGFRLYRPAFAWGGPDALYWYRRVSRAVATSTA